MPVYVKGGHVVNVSGEEAVAQFEAAGYSLAEPAEQAPDDKPGKAKPAKKSEK